MDAYPAIADCAVTAAAMRAAASIIEESALAGLSVTCDSGQITVQVCEWSGNPAERAAQVGQLAAITGTHAYQHDSRTTAWTQIKACGQARGIPVVITCAAAVESPAFCSSTGNTLAISASRSVRIVTLSPTWTRL